MFKIIFPAILCLAFACPLVGQAQDCATCCEPQPCCQETRKKLQIVEVQKEVCRLKRVCVVDECGCEKMKFVKVKECVTRKRLALVDVPVDPCKKSCFERFCDKIRSKCASCCDTCCDPCCDPCCQ